MTNKAVFMTGIGRLETREIEMPVIKGNQVLIKIEYVGICGSDVHYLEHGKIGDFVVEGDFILGHECAGVVVETGPDVKTLKIGDKVALEPGQTCGQCAFCKGGRYNLCPDVAFLATPPYHGCLMNYIAYPETMAFKLPESMGTKEGALVEPFAVGVHGAKQGGIALGSSAVILGAGCIGLMTLAACRAFGARDITVVDVMEKRLECAKKLGASRVINAATDDVEKALSNTADVVFETAGATKTIGQTPHLVKTGGTIVLVGMAPEDIIPFNIAKILSKEVAVKTVFRYRNIYPQAIDAISAGTAKIGGVVTHEFSFSEAKKAFDYVINNKGDVVKAVIKMG